jgi:hypothetical protein
MLNLLYICVYTAGGVLFLAAMLTWMHRWHRIFGQRTLDSLMRAPALDVIVSLFTWVPWVYGANMGGWAGIPAAIIGQVGALLLWITWHERTHAQAVSGPTIFRTLNRLVGRWQNHAALWVTVMSLPGFLFIRLQQYICYPLLVLLLKFPRYRQAEWVNVSRQKFDGLVGHDLIWCLYCDWMTGVYSLGAEMLRNVESFWCPIRFYHGKKCDNCKLDFPDVAKGWVPADGTMSQVVDKLEQHYGDGRREWFNHPARLTVNGKPHGDATAADAPTHE